MDNQGVGEVNPLTLTVPLPPNIANGRMHWQVKLKAKKAYWDTLSLLANCGKIPAEAVSRPRRARLAATLYLHSPMDDDNAMARLKWLVDWLVSNGYLAGDSRKHIEWEGLPKQFIDRKNPRCVVTLTPAAG